jgi:L-iditol 2-dehydrogenase
MKAARLHGVGDVRVDEEPEPCPAAGEELLRVDAVGICGSDLHWFAEGSIGDAQLASPLVLGHEIGATVLSGRRAGQRVVVDPAVPCRTCPPCRDGNPNLCVRVTFAGHGRTDGGLREQMSWPADRLHSVPDSLSDESIPMLEPLGVAMHALDLAHQRVAEVVGIVGCGPIGLMAIQLALVGGARAVVATEPLAHRRAAAAAAGAIAVAPTDAAAAADEIAAGRGLDVVVEIAGTDSGVQSAIDLAKPGGRIVLAGIPGGDETTFTASAARRKGLTIMMCRRMKEMYPRAIALAAAKRVDLDVIVTDQFPLDAVAQGLRSASERRGGKVLIRA